MDSEQSFVFDMLVYRIEHTFYKYSLQNVSSDISIDQIYSQNEKTTQVTNGEVISNRDYLEIGVKVIDSDGNPIVFNEHNTWYGDYDYFVISYFGDPESNSINRSQMNFPVDVNNNNGIASFYKINLYRPDYANEIYEGELVFALLCNKLQCDTTNKEVLEGYPKYYVVEKKVMQYTERNY